MTEISKNTLTLRDHLNDGFNSQEDFAQRLVLNESVDIKHKRQGATRNTKHQFIAYKRPITDRVRQRLDREDPTVHIRILELNTGRTWFTVVANAEAARDVLAKVKELGEDALYEGCPEFEIV